jgi:cell wall-associated NlpC family hydrolase
MYIKLFVIFFNFFTAILLVSCWGDIQTEETKLAYYTHSGNQTDTIKNPGKTIQNSIKIPYKPTKYLSIKVNNTNPNEVVEFAQTLIGIPYVYGSTNPQIGFDCSGFITYIFEHFNIKVPRSSFEFANIGETVSQENAKPGDLILFTSPSVDNSTSAVVGHMGLITSNKNSLITFIHSTSGKAMSVTLTPLNGHYQKRFLRISRIFHQNN